MRWQRGPASWLEWPWPAGGCAWAGFRHTQIDQLAGCRMTPGPCAGGRLRGHPPGRHGGREGPCFDTANSSGQLAVDHGFDTPKSFDIPKCRQVSQARAGRSIPQARPSPGAPCGRTHGPGQGVLDGLGGGPREIGRMYTKSLKWRSRSLQLAHFVWGKCRARTTYIVKGCPRETFCTR